MPRRRFPFFPFDWDEDFDIFEEMDEFFKRFMRRFGDFDPEKMFEKLPDVELPSGARVKGPYIFGYSVTVGPDGKPVVRYFGNVSPGARRTPEEKSEIKEISYREPLVDIIEEANEIIVIAEIPGVEKEDIKIFGTGRQIRIEASHYKKVVDLPVDVDVDKATSTYKNGILEVHLPKKGGEKGKEIRVG
ncbi:MAG: archaeal heat shock protein Hsp20 [Candidatus Korarchaeota archaeon]